MSPYKPAQGGYLDSILPSILGTGSLGKGITAGLDAYSNRSAGAQPPAQGQGYAAGGTPDTRSILEQQAETVPGYGQQGRDFGREILYRQYLPPTKPPVAPLSVDANTGKGLSALSESNSALGGNDSLQKGHTPGEFGLPGATTNASGDSGPTTGLASFGNSLAATLGNMGLTGLSTSIAQSVDPNYGHEGRHSLSAPTVDTSPMGPALDTAIGPALDVDSTDVSSTETGPSSMGFGIEGGGYGGMSGDGDGGGGGADGSGGGPGDSGGPRARGGVVGQYARGGLSTLGSYSDGGRLLRGPGDGVSDSIPATIGKKRQPARLADGEFVVPARIVSELGNGSTEAGARKLYAMLDRIQANRKKSIGKGKVAANSRSDKQLPA